EAAQVVDLDVADVEGAGGDVRRFRPEQARPEQVGVQALDLVSGLTQKRHHDAADITVVPRHQDAHGWCSFRYGPRLGYGAPRIAPRASRRIPATLHAGCSPAGPGHWWR